MGFIRMHCIPCHSPEKAVDKRPAYRCAHTRIDILETSVFVNIQHPDVHAYHILHLHPSSLLSRGCVCLRTHTLLVRDPHLLPRSPAAARWEHTPQDSRVFIACLCRSLGLWCQCSGSPGPGRLPALGGVGGDSAACLPTSGPGLSMSRPGVHGAVSRATHDLCMKRAAPIWPPSRSWPFPGASLLPTHNPRPLGKPRPTANYCGHLCEPPEELLVPC